MALQDIFQARIEQLRAFARHSQRSLLCIRVAPDIKQVLIKVLAGLDEDPNSPYVMIGADTPFCAPGQYFEGLAAQVLEDYERNRAELDALGARPRFDRKDGSALSAAEKYLSVVTALAESLPSPIRALVTVLNPERIEDETAYRAAMDELAKGVPLRRVKHIVLDDRVNPVLGDIAERCLRAAVEDFHFAPEAVEDRLKADLLNPRLLSPFEVRQYTALLASFSFARKEYADCLALQHQCLEMIERDGSPQELANALYNLGNTQLALGDLADAEACYARSVDLCIDNQVSSLLPMALTNLGVALYRQRRVEESARAFRIAREVSQNQRQRIIEAYVLDCMAKLCADDSRPGGAEQYWREALALYDGITSEFFADIRAAGRADILAKLEGLYRSTGQSAKLAEMQRQQAAD